MQRKRERNKNLGIEGEASKGREKLERVAAEFSSKSLRKTGEADGLGKTEKK